MSLRSSSDKDPPFAHGNAHDARNACFFVEVRRVDNDDVDRDREVAKLVEHADRGVVAATNDRHDDEQVNVRVGAVITARNRPVQNDSAGIAPLDNPVGDS